MPAPAPAALTPDEARVQLFATPMDEFVEARKRIAAELARSGHADVARELRKLRRPSASAWASNQIVRTATSTVHEFFAASDRLRDLQSAVLSGSADRQSFQAALEDVRSATAALNQSARDALATAGRAAPPTLVERIVGNFRAAALEPPQRESLLSGQLTEDLRPTTDGLTTVFGLDATAVSARPAKAAPPSSGHAATAAHAEADKRKLARLRALADAQATEADATAAADRARTAAEQAVAARDAARAKLTEVQHAAKQAERSLRAAEEQMQRARRDLSAAEAEARRTRAARIREERAADRDR